MSSKPGSVYKSLETDDEVIARVRRVWGWFKPYLRGAELDELLWDSFRVQRRLIERTTER